MNENQLDIFWQVLFENDVVLQSLGDFVRERGLTDEFIEWLIENGGV
jgi:hypothetical protein